MQVVQGCRLQRLALTCKLRLPLAISFQGKCIWLNYVVVKNLRAIPQPQCATKIGKAALKEGKITFFNRDLCHQQMGHQSRRVTWNHVQQFLQREQRLAFVRKAFRAATELERAYWLLTKEKQTKHSHLGKRKTLRHNT